MLISSENRRLREDILRFDGRIDRMHIDFLAYRAGDAPRMPDWEGLEKELIGFSRRKIFDLELRNQLDRVMYKFQNRKKIWLKWADEYQKQVL